MLRLCLRLLPCCVLFALLSSCAVSQVIRVESPNGELALMLNPQGALHYSVEFRGKRVFEESALGLKLEGQDPLGPGMHQVHIDALLHGLALSRWLNKKAGRPPVKRTTGEVEAPPSEHSRRHTPGTLLQARGVS